MAVKITIHDRVSARDRISVLLVNICSVKTLSGTIKNNGNKIRPLAGWGKIGNLCKPWGIIVQDKIDLQGQYIDRYLYRDLIKCAFPPVGQ